MPIRIERSPFLPASRHNDTSRARAHVLRFREIKARERPARRARVSPIEFNFVMQLMWMSTNDGTTLGYRFVRSRPTPPSLLCPLIVLPRAHAFVLPTNCARDKFALTSVLRVTSIFYDEGDNVAPDRSASGADVFQNYKSSRYPPRKKDARASTDRSTMIFNNVIVISRGRRSPI